MTLKEAAAIVKNEADGRIPIGGYETEHFYVFTSLGYLYDEPLIGSPMFVIDKETKQTGFLPSFVLALCSPGLDSGWEQFKQYESDEIIRDDEINDELEKMFKK